MNQWAAATGYPDLTRLLSDIDNSDAAAVKNFEDTNCPYTGSLGATPAEQDARAISNLTSAIGTAQQFLSNGGDTQPFMSEKADVLYPTVVWSSWVMQPNPWPGLVFISQSTSPGISLVSISETGKQFCALVTPRSVVRGTTTDGIRTDDSSPMGEARIPDRVTCNPDG